MSKVRKISIGSDYKGSSMHYICGQSVLNGMYKIHLINIIDGRACIWIEKDLEVFIWKEFNENMPISIEYNIDF